MKSVFFDCESAPTPAKFDTEAADRFISIGALACCNVLLEGLGISAQSFLAQLAKEFPGEENLAALMAEAYIDMAKRMEFLLAGSAVPFTFARQPEGGHFFLHVPKGADETTPVLLLLHGYGGNLLYFPWAIWKENPDFILIAPSWQIDWTEGRFADLKLTSVLRSNAPKKSWDLK